MPKTRASKRVWYFHCTLRLPPSHRSMPVLPQLPVSRPCRRRERGREGPKEGQRGAKAGHADPSESSGHYYSPSMIQANINHRHQLPVWPVFQCEKLLTLTITWCKGKPLSKNLKAKLHLHLRLQLPCLRWHQTHESDLFSHLFFVNSFIQSGALFSGEKICSQKFDWEFISYFRKMEEYST